MIYLDNSLLIGRGTLRACYLHPENGDLVIKVPAEAQDQGRQANHKELKGYRWLVHKHGRLDWISHCHNIVETSLGPGLICDCIRDEDGAVSKTVWDLVIYQEACDIEYLQQVAGKFCDMLIERNIFLFDINLKNIALKRLIDGSYQPYAIDLKGPYDNHEFLRLSSQIKYLGRKKLRRRAAQLLARIAEFRQRREELRGLEAAGD
jgi:hypothetical protein